MRITRKSLLMQSLAMALLAGRAIAQVNSVKPVPMIKRPATIEWAAAETIIALGCMPIATASLDQRPDTMTPSLSRVAKIGSMFAPNFEDLQDVHPDLIFCADWQQDFVPSLRRIAPVHVFDLRHPSKQALENTFRFTADVGARLSRTSEATAFQNQARLVFDGLKRRLQPLAERPVLLGTLEPDGRHISVFGEGHLFDAVLRRVGLTNAWVGPMSGWGTSFHGIEALSDYPNTPFLYLDVGQRTAAAKEALASSTMWNALPSVKRGYVRPISYEWPFGGLPTALRFGQNLASTMTAQI